VLASLILLPAYAIVIAPPGDGDEGCPSPRQTSEALQARVPWAMLPAGQPAVPGTLRLAVSATAAGVRLQLSDAAGETVLVRTLPPGARGKPADCPALADTVALIVERYLHDVGYEAPPLPPGPPPAAAVARAPPPAPPASAQAVAPWRLGLAFEGRYGDTGSLEGSALLCLGFERPAGTRRLGLRASGGLGPRSDQSWDDEQGSLRRIPLRLGAYLGLRAGPGWVEPGLDAGVSLLFASVTRGPTAPAGQNENDKLHFAPSAGVGVSYSVFLPARLYLRALARGGAAIPYGFVATVDRREVEVFSTPRTYLELGVESGIAFP
jgi:hypothetical protein